MSGPPQNNDTRSFRRYTRRIVIGLWIAVLALISSLFLACKQPDEEKSGILYSDAAPPRKQEFRWSNGKAPKSFDPALAAAPPETDIVRAIYEGLTDVDPKSLHEVPGVAERWSASDDDRTWTFQLRKNARWSNGDPVRAVDFVRSWKRLSEMGETVAHHELLDNIVGMHPRREPVVTPSPSPEPLKVPQSDPIPAGFLSSARINKGKPSQTPLPESPAIERKESDRSENHKIIAADQKFGVEALGDLVLKVTLIAPDKDLPRLVANPIFRPIFGDGKNFVENPLDPSIVTNGAFQISSAGPDGVVVTRSEQYWDAASVKLESVRFVPAQSAEKALASYRSGDLDAVTNADLEPLALKLLSPYADFRQATHNALNFFEFNLSRFPFNDRRVREALATGFERDRLTEGEMKGSTEPAYHFLPYDTDVTDKLTQDTENAKRLLESAGFPDGENFPVIHLVVNRNETQLRIARSVVRMWKQNLNLNAEIVIKETAEMDSVRTAGDFDLIRRGVVFPTVDRYASFSAIFPAERKLEAQPALRHENESVHEPALQQTEPPRAGGPNIERPVVPQSAPLAADLDFDAAIYDFRLIPLYFPMSYGLVKPYVQGFDINGLDSPSLKNVRIDSDWQPKP